MTRASSRKVASGYWNETMPGAPSRTGFPGPGSGLRLRCALLVIGATLGAQAAAAQTRDLPHDLDALEQAWHGCVREAYARQVPNQSRAGAQRNVLDECREHEDTLVAATMTLREREDEAARRAGLPLTIRAGAWAASVAAYVVDPVASWLQGRQR